MKTISLISQKGGVGKTTLAINLAVTAVSKGASVVIADTDPQQSVAHWYAARRAEHPLPCAASVFPDALPAFVDKARENKADFLFIDSSPNSTEDSLTVADQSDLLVIPCSPSFVDLRALKRTENVVRLSSKPAVAVLNLCPPYGAEADQAESALRQLGLDVCPIRIGARASARRVYALHSSALEFDPQGKSAKEFAALWSSLRAHDALARLQATTIVTNIRAGRGKKHRQFSWIEGWTDDFDERRGMSRGMSITLAEWFCEGVMMEGGLLAIDPAYFSITGGRERWLYRVARKHAGGAGAAGFPIRFATLFEKSGAEGHFRRFKFELLKIAREDALPGYALSIEREGEPDPILRMKRRDAEVAPAAPIAKPKPAASSNHLTDRTLAQIRKDFPGWDVYALKADFDGWIAEKGQPPDDYQAAFYGYVKKHHAMNAA